MAEHFAEPPQWQYWILAYFFLGGLTGGLYVLGTLLRLSGGEGDEAAAPIAFRWAFPILLLCPIFLIADLGRPVRFWHMLIDTTPGHMSPSFISGSPMSVGSWALLAYGFVALVSFLQASGSGGVRATERVGFGALLNVIGAILGAFVASYTGVLLSVSNQPVWSDTWALGGLFLASALAASAALLAWLVHESGLEGTETRLYRAERAFTIIELILIIAFFIDLAAAGVLWRTLSGAWLVVWLLVFTSLIPQLVGTAPRALRIQAGMGDGRHPDRGVSATTILVSALAGTLLLRFAVLFSGQF